MELKYANESNVLILISLLKQHGIKRVVASPGTTNLSFVASLQCDSFFEIYSCVDERSAAYMACGLSAETGEPVVITCTGATASRNYVSALTEAYYRKLPILVVTGTQNPELIGNLSSQLIDRSQAQKDILKSSYSLTSFNESDKNAEFFCVLKANKAISDLTRQGGGPVHINLQTCYTRDFSIDTLPKVKTIRRISYENVEEAPEMPVGRVGIFVGSHNTFSKELTAAIDSFCASHDAVVFCDHTSGYYGRYKVNFSLATVQVQSRTSLAELDLCIHIGEISAEYGMLGNLAKKIVWRVSPDGEMRDQFRTMSYVFEMSEVDFFNFYRKEEPEENHAYFDACQSYNKSLYERIPDLPFSNVWIASQLAHRIPEGASIHFGILNSIRSWNLFQLPKTVTSFSNVGGFGIDGCVSSMIGASFANPNKLYFGVVGDLSFFYDMNSLGNRHIGNNVRLLIVNNGKGTEFRNFYHTGSLFGEEADKYIAAGGHFGNKSHNLVKNYCEDLGYEYLSANNFDEFHRVCDRFVNSMLTDRPMVLEVFTTNENESDAISKMWNIERSANGVIGDLKSSIIKQSKKILGRKGIAIIKILKS